jgi:hypothetical protein
MEKHDPYMALRYGAFRRYLSGALASTLGNQSVDIAVGWHLYEQTHSYWALFLIGMSNYLPILLFSLPAGLLADRFERRRILQCTTLAGAMAALGLAWLAHYGGPEWYWYGLLFLAATARAFQTPAAVSFYPTLIPREAIFNAVSWGSSNFQIGAIMGPILGGLLLRFFGSPAAFIFGAIGPLFFFTMILGIRPLRESDVPSELLSLRQRLSGGLQFVLSQKEILSAITLDLFAVLFGGVEGIMPAFAIDVLHCGSLGLGFLKAAPFAGAFMMGFYLAHRPMIDHAGKRMLGAVTGFGLCMIVFGLSRSFLLSLLMLTVSGMLDNISVVVRQTLVQLRTPEELRGRVQAINFLFIGSSNELGYAESGGAALLMGAVPSVLFGGVSVILVVGVVAWAWPELRQLGRLR